MNQTHDTRPVLLYGHLRKRFGKRFVLAVSTPAEAIRALCAVVPGFAEAFREGSYKILVGGEPQTLETVGAPCGGLGISIVPVVQGGKDDFMQVLTGAALIALAVANPAWLAAYPALGSAVMGLGVSLALGGVSRMLAGNPDMRGPAGADDPGHYFNGAENTVGQGGCVPVGYGEMLIGSSLISVGTSPEQYPSGKDGGPFAKAVDETWTKLPNGSGDEATRAWANNGNGSSIPWKFCIDPVE